MESAHLFDATCGPRSPGTPAFSLLLVLSHSMQYILFCIAILAFQSNPNRTSQVMSNSNNAMNDSAVTRRDANDHSATTRRRDVALRITAGIRSERANSLARLPDLLRVNLIELLAEVGIVGRATVELE